MSKQVPEAEQIATIVTLLENFQELFQEYSKHYLQSWQQLQAPLALSEENKSTPPKMHP